MKRFEYMRELYYHTDQTVTQFMSSLNKLGHDGWQVVSMLGDSRAVWVYFKREIVDGLNA
jgi:hypothetical protein